MKKFWNTFKLRATLFRIWFMKNMIVFLQVFLVVCVVLTLSGVIKENTPILGVIIYPIFEGIIDEVNEMKSAQGSTVLVNILATCISVFVSIGMFTLKLKSICLADIKSDKLKLALIKANMYFNSDGKLVRRVERVTRTDIDGDGLIDKDETTSEEVLSKGFFSGIKTAVQEFATIATAKLDTEDDYKETLDKADLTKSAEELEAVELEQNEQNIEKTEEIVDGIMEEEIQKVETAEDETEETKEIKKNFIVREFTAFKNWIRKIFTKKKKEDEITEEQIQEYIKENPTEDDIIIENNLKEDEEKVTTEISEETKTEEKEEVTSTTVSTEVETPKPVEAPKKQEVPKRTSARDFASRLLK